MDGFAHDFGVSVKDGDTRRKNYLFQCLFVGGGLFFYKQGNYHGFLTGDLFKTTVSIRYVNPF